MRKWFNESFERLRKQSNRLAGTARTSENFDEIVEQRVELDRLRDEAVKERKNIVSRFEPPAPDVVLPPRGYVSTRLLGKVAAAVSIVLLAVIGFFVVKLVQDFTAEFPLAYLAVDESVDADPDADTCRWTVGVTLRNDSDRTVSVAHMTTVLDRQSRGAAAVAYPTLEPGGTAVATGVWTMRNVAVCPAAADVSHGNLVVHLEDGTEVSRAF